ncbi:hypothetical protein AQ616_09425 [Oceanobacillus sp. E9]|uniref:hypothetical protein n=1 Tax=Oceanobacillus sp. E9 TaxID=1742575 RepID=UPI00084EC7AC|nr:hypothetical protein [Oceanobacillus sp. E9]OEH53998.1 hypothetical protein AQ616_09425 [Oceanobacillus sp. E9]
METFSIWDLNKEQNFLEVINTYKTYKSWANIETDPFDGDNLEFLIDVKEDENYIYEFNNKNIRFVEVQYRREKVYSKEANNPQRDKRIKLTDITFYVYEFMGKVRFLVLRGNSRNTLTALRAATNCTKNNDITNDDLEINEDFFYWVFQRYMNFNGKELHHKTNIFVDALTGYSGSTRDSVNDMWGKGSRISKILVTLAFLFNNDSLKSLTPDFKIDDENLEVELTLSGTFKFNIESHIGKYFFEADETIKKASLLLLFVLEIFPSVKKAYNNHLEDETWGVDHQLNFIAGIGAEIQDRVEEKLTDISLQLERED